MTLCIFMLFGYFMENINIIPTTMHVYIVMLYRKSGIVHIANISFLNFSWDFNFANFGLHEI